MGCLQVVGENTNNTKELIDATFGIINYNDHYDVGMYQPMMVASKDIIKDDKVRNKLIDKC